MEVDKLCCSPSVSVLSKKTSIHFLSAWIILLYLISPVHLNLSPEVLSSLFSLTIPWFFLQYYSFCFLSLFKCTLESHGKLLMRCKHLCVKLFLTLAQQVNHRHFLRLHWASDFDIFWVTQSKENTQYWLMEISWTVNQKSWLTSNTLLWVNLLISEHQIFCI